MKLNYDCVRDTLFGIEELLVLEDTGSGFEMQTVSMEKLFSNHYCEKYNKSDVAYSLICLEKEDFIQANFLYGSGQLADAIISDITYEGHQFIEQIRSKTVWDKSKSIFKNLGTISIDIIKSVTSTVISDTINQYIPKL